MAHLIEKTKMPTIAIALASYRIDESRKAGEKLTKKTKMAAN